MTEEKCSRCRRPIPHGTGGTVSDRYASYRLCHPDDPAQEDCYRLVTVYGKRFGQSMNLVYRGGRVLEARRNP